MMKNIVGPAMLAASIAVSGCTPSGDIYDSSKHDKEDFDLGNTILLGIGAAALIGAAAAGADTGSGSGGYGSGYASDYDWDWDYQPANGQWVCRGIQTGQYAELENCAYDYQDDDRWPD